MANVPITAGSGTNVATNAITRDAVTEQMQLFNLADPTAAAGVCASVNPAGTAGVNALAVQGITGGVNQNVKSANDSSSTTSVPATASNLVIKGSAGRLVSAVVTAVGTTNLLIYDNATTNSGTVIGVIPSTAAVGDVFVWALPAANGITAAKATTTPVVTLGWN